MGGLVIDGSFSGCQNRGKSIQVVCTSNTGAVWRKKHWRFSGFCCSWHPGCSSAMRDSGVGSPGLWCSWLCHPTLSRRRTSCCPICWLNRITRPVWFWKNTKSKNEPDSSVFNKKAESFLTWFPGRHTEPQKRTRKALKYKTILSSFSHFYFLGTQVCVLVFTCFISRVWSVLVFCVISLPQSVSVVLQFRIRLGFICLALSLS